MLGWINKGFQLGTGIHYGWDMAYSWIKDLDVEKLRWISTEFICSICGEPITEACVPAPFILIVLRCKNSHKYCYENTD